MSQSTTETSSYFNLHTAGIGYLNRIREVPVRRGKPFVACDIAALHGASDDVEYTRFDCKVSGTDAEQLVRRCAEAVQANKKVLVSFRIGDLWVDPFMYEKGERAGQPGASLKGRLHYIGWIKIDGEVKYLAPTKDDTSTGDQPQAAATESETPEPQPTSPAAEKSLEPEPMAASF